MWNSNATDCLNDVKEKFGISKILISIPGIFLNCLFILTMIRNKTLRKSLILMTFLSFGDLLLAVKGFTLGVNDLTDDNHNFTKVDCLSLKPHASLIIIGTLVQSTGTFLVAIERATAILAPYWFFLVQKTTVLLAICFGAGIFIMATYSVGVILAATSANQTVFNNMCYPSTIINVTYSGFLYLYPSTVGSFAIVCYVFVFGYIFWRRFLTKLPIEDRFADVQSRKQMWLLKICSILAFTTFVFVVVPNIVLYIETSDNCSKSLYFYVRKYVSFLQCINSFFGMTLSVFISSELRSAFKSTLCCSSNRAEAIVERIKVERLSSPKVSYEDSCSTGLSTPT